LDGLDSAGGENLGKIERPDSLDEMGIQSPAGTEGGGREYIMAREVADLAEITGGLLETGGAGVHPVHIGGLISVEPIVYRSGSAYQSAVNYIDEMPVFALQPVPGGVPDISAASVSSELGIVEISIVNEDGSFAPQRMVPPPLYITSRDFRAEGDMLDISGLPDAIDISGVPPAFRDTFVDIIGGGADGEMDIFSDVYLQGLRDVTAGAEIGAEQELTARVLESVALAVAAVTMGLSGVNAIFVAEGNKKADAKYVSDRELIHEETIRYTFTNRRPADASYEKSRNREEAVVYTHSTFAGGGNPLNALVQTVYDRDGQEITVSTPRGVIIFLRRLFEMSIAAIRGGGGDDDDMPRVVARALKSIAPDNAPDDNGRLTVKFGEWDETGIMYYIGSVVTYNGGT
jgi:hypothetical protein